MQTTITETEFERMSWHDCHIWSLALRVGDPDENDWTMEDSFELASGERNQFRRSGIYTDTVGGAGTNGKAAPFFS